MNDLGSFNERGSFKKDRPKNLAGLDGFLASLIRLRRSEPGLEPWELAKRISQSIHRHAFPNAVDTNESNRLRWTATVLSNSIPWSSVGVGTSAESLLKYATQSPCLMPYDPSTTVSDLVKAIAEAPANQRRQRLAKYEAEKARQLAIANASRETPPAEAHNP